MSFHLILISKRLYGKVPSIHSYLRLYTIGTKMMQCECAFILCACGVFNRLIDNENIKWCTAKHTRDIDEIMMRMDKHFGIVFFSSSVCNTEKNGCGYYFGWIYDATGLLAVTCLVFFSNKYAIQLNSSKIELIHVNNSISYVSVSMSRFDRFFPIVVAFLCVNNHATQMFFGVFTKDDLCGMTKYRR